MGKSHFIHEGEGFFEKGEFLEDGTYLSPVVYMPDFKGLVLSWNCETPGDSSIKIDGRIRMAKLHISEVEMETNPEVDCCDEPEWSEWLSWGQWGNSIKRGSLKSEKECNGVTLSVDTLEITDDSKVGDRFQFRISYFGEGEKPRVKLVAENLLPVERKHGDWGIEELGEKLHMILDVPSFSQMRRDPYTARVMCSATCCAMVLNYYGFDVLPEEAAWGLKDFDYGEANCGFGNWSFNTAYLGSQGFESYVKSMTLKELKDEIKSGRPTAVSVAYSNKPEDGLPYIPSAPTRTPGHIILVCGFSHKDGNEYVVVNDPAAQVNQGVRRLYPINDFLEAWEHSNYNAYIAKPTEELISQKTSKYPIRKKGVLKRAKANSKALILYENKKEINILTDEIAVILYKCHDCEYCEYIDVEIAAKELLYESIQWKRKSGPLMFINKVGQVILADLEEEGQE